MWFWILYRDGGVLAWVRSTLGMWVGRWVEAKKGFGGKGENNFCNLLPDISLADDHLIDDGQDLPYSRRGPSTQRFASFSCIPKCPPAYVKADVLGPPQKFQTKNRSSDSLLSPPSTTKIKSLHLISQSNSLIPLNPMPIAQPAATVPTPAPIPKSLR